MRIAVVGLNHESNTFLPTPTRRDDFEVHVGEALRERRASTHHELAGMLDGLRQAGLRAVPVFDAEATPSGRIEREAFDGLVAALLDEVRARGPFDGVLAAAHGAAVAEGHDDADGDWLGALRGLVGPDTPIVVTVDAHANLTPRMLAASDALLAYRTNPHLDTFDRGAEAASLMGRIVRGEVRPTQAGAFPPMAINILLQGTSEHPCLPLVELVDAMRGRPGIVGASLALGFPYADVPEVGTSFCVVSDGDRALAEQGARELAKDLLARRHEFVPRLISPEDAVHAAAVAEPPVCLLDMGDNVGGGSAADGTTLARIVAERGGPSAFISLYDPESAARARALGPGGRGRLRLGGKTDALHGEPLEIDVLVRSLHAGRFRESDVRHGGRDRYDMGQTAILETGRGLTVQVTSKRVPPFSLGQLTSCGLDPASFHILVAKGVHAPVPAYAPVCRTIIRVDTPGSTAADMGALPFRRRRVPLFPLEELERVHETGPRS